MPGERRGPAGAADAVQGAVLALLVEEHPAQRTIHELLRAMYAHPGAFAERDAIDNAIRDLVAAGLLHRHDDFVFATHAAVRCQQLVS